MGLFDIFHIDQIIKPFVSAASISKYTEAFVDIFVSFLKADVQSMGETVANKLADEATKGVLPKVTIDEFIYAQAWEGSKTVSINALWDFKDIYEGSAEGFTSYDDAAQFIMTVQGNELGMAALSMPC